MPALHPSKSAARKAVTALDKIAKGAKLSRAVADRSFMPAWGRATEYIPVNSNGKLNNDAKRNFSSAVNHEFCVDYWKVHADQHVTLDSKANNNVIDYWKAHNETHIEESLPLSHQHVEVKRSFSTNNHPSSSSSKKATEELIDYWHAHTGSNMLDYWDEHPKSHL
jgi:hypothetical protein